MNIYKKLLFGPLAIILLIGVLVGFPEPAAAAPQAAVCKEWHTVARGEYLVKIALEYDTSWRTLAEINRLKSPYTIYPGQKLCIAASGVVVTPSPSPIPATPAVSRNGRVYAQSVVEDRSVTLRGEYLTAEAHYAVYLLNEKFGLDLSRGTLVGSATTNKSGGFLGTFNLPKSLRDVAKIKVVLRSANGTTISNWFYNATAEYGTGGIGSPSFSFSIVAVREDDWVEIKTSGMPANATFTVLIGKAGTRGIDGIQVGTLRDNDGVVRARFEIPSELHDRTKLDLRLENKPLGTAVYQTFTNETSR